MERKLTLLFWFIFIFSYAFSKDGDTLHIETIKFSQPKYGWFNFPDSVNKFQKILMNYKIKCPCGEWDYLAMVFVKQFYAPSFRVDSTIVPFFSFIFDTAWSYSAKIQNGKLLIDSFPKKPRLLEFYTDAENPTKRTSFMYVWDPYYRYTFNDNGEIVDSVLVPPDSTIYLEKRRIYYQDPIAITERYEIMRFVTPYGIGLDVGAGFNWTMDVTDFAPLLSGKVYLDAPNQQEDIEISFDFIEGIPERNIIRLERIYDFYDVVYDSAFEKKIAKTQVQVSPQEKMFRLKVIQTGHGFGGNEDNCCEFCKKNAYVKVNDTVRYTKEVWRICSENPLFPQGGTWLFNRTNWCPGAEVQPFDFELSPYIGNKRSFTFDYDMDYYNKPYSSGSNTIGRWIITAYVISYSELNFDTDAEIYDIVSPSKKDIYKRLNPISTSPQVVVKNRGKEEIKSLKFKYGIVGAKEYFYEWEGSIPSLSKAQITLPSLDCSDWGSASRTFKVEITEVNGKSDDYLANNTGYSTFDPPPSLYKNLVVKLRTNNYDALTSNPEVRPYSLMVVNGKGSILLQRNDYLPSSNYTDTLILDDGCYELHFYNEFECGLGFWYFNRLFGLQDGLLQLTSDNLVLYQPGVDFGYSLHYHFIAEDQPTVSVFPDTVDFGNVELGKDAFYEVIIKPSNNKGLTAWDFKIVLGESKGLTIERIEPQISSNQKIELKYGDSAKVLIKFTPKKEGKLSTSLTFSTNDRKNPLVVIPIKAYVIGGSNVEDDRNRFDVVVSPKGPNLYEVIIPTGFFDMLHCEIYNLIGEMVKSYEFDFGRSDTFTLDLSLLPAGMYFVKFTGEKEIKVLPLLVVKP
jgi:hypothetical protein